MEKTNFYRTDLLDESEEFVRHRSESEKKKLEKAEGIELDETKSGRVAVTSVVVDGDGEKRIGKKKGTYITMTVPHLNVEDEDGFKQLKKAFLQKFRDMHKHLPKDGSCKVLFIGLGNRDVTPDAVGPWTIDRIQNYIPEFYSSDGSAMYAYAPGVTIQTGLETANFVKAVANEIKPDQIIAIDALAARDSSRLCRTIQLTDTGIHPGSGVGNSRKELSKETLGVPVTAIGVPTVVDGPVLIADAIDQLFSYIATQIEEKESPANRLSVSPWLKSTNKNADRTPLKPIFGDWSNWPHEDRIQLFEEVLTNHELRTFISPKDIDAWANLYADVLAESLSEWLRELTPSH